MNLKKWFTIKKIVLYAIAALIIGGVAYQANKGKNGSGKIVTETVKKQDLKQTVLATGQVTSATDLNLSFKTSGVVTKLDKAVGDQVYKGDVLATLDQKDQLAALTTARGGLEQAQANYQKILAGASSQDVAVSQAAVDAAQSSLDNAKVAYSSTVQQQAVLVTNAYSAMLNSGLAVIPATSDSSTATATISGTYTGTAQGTYSLSMYVGGGGTYYTVTGLENSAGSVVRGVALALGTRGIYITFSTSGTLNPGDTWTIPIPNTQASTYLTNSNAYQASLQTQNQAVVAAQATITTAQTALTQAQAQLNLKQAQARPEDVAAAQAQVLSAQGQFQTAQASLENTEVIAPADGTVTSIDVKLGESATAQKEVIILQDINDLHLEAQISEANIANLHIGQTVDVTFDALGPDQHFSATVTLIDPASTVISGVVNYKVTASLPKADQVKPGMTANMTILTAQKSGVLAVSQRAVINRDTKKIVRVITDPKTKTYREQEVTLGLMADDGLVEVTSGVNDGEEIVSFINP